MSLKTSLAWFCALGCLTCAARGEDAWLQLKAGMNRFDTQSALGTPLFKNVNRGFELWIYDSGAEVVCYRGTLVAWTAPAGHGNGEGRQLDLRFFLKPVIAPAPVRIDEPETRLDLAPVREMRLPKL